MAVPWRYEANLRRIRDIRSGRFLGPSEKHALRESYIDAMHERSQALVTRLASGDLTLQDWLEQMRTLVRTSHSDMAMLARGGIHGMDALDRQNLSETIRAQWNYLQRFAGAVSNGDMTEAAIAARADMYVNAARLSYEEANRKTAIENGAQYEHNVLHARESCPGCVAETMRGWVPLNQLSAVGSRDCNGGCKCTIQYAYREPDAPMERMP